MKLIIKNMVSIRCKMIVKSELENLGLEYTSIDLGEVEINGEFPFEKHEQLKTTLKRSGLELMDDKNAMLIRKIQNVVIEMVHYADEFPQVNFSSYLSAKLNYDYDYMSRVFSEVKGVTIEHYLIIHKIERVKELIIYDELSFKEIAYKLNYSSIAHLSTQFKKITGLTPTFFKALKHKKGTWVEGA